MKTLRTLAVASAAMLLVPVANAAGFNMRVLNLTNDAFSGLNSLPLETVPVGESLSFDAIAWDADTETDTELGAEIHGAGRRR